MVWFLVLVLVWFWFWYRDVVWFVVCGSGTGILVDTFPHPHNLSKNSD
jgi:hypothetical protein